MIETQIACHQKT